MEPAAELIVRLTFMLIFGGATAAIASHKGRNTVGWFFVGFFFSCIGLIVILCMSNLREEEDRWNRSMNEQRRLREQLRQERLKNQAFQGHVKARLDVHDQALGMDTRQLAEGEAAPAPAGIAAPEGELPDPSTFRDREWFVQIGDRRSKGLNFQQLKAVYQSGRVTDQNLVWTSGMESWRKIIDVPGLLEEIV